MNPAVLATWPRERLLAALALPTNASPTIQKALRDALYRPASPTPALHLEGLQRGREDAGRASLTVVLPLPDKALSPNARVHWAKKAKAVREARHAAYVAAALVLDARSLFGPLPAVPRWDSATALATFYFKDRRRRDPDNLLASLKSAFDGLADAGVVANDSGITHLPVRIEVDRSRPRVELLIRRS